MKFNQFLLAGTALLAMATACTDNDDNSEWGKSHQAITFNATIQGLTQSRAAGSEWSAGDKIGIYLKKNGAALADATYANKQYTSSESGMLQATTTNDAVYYPSNGSAVDFIAYYPYQSTLTDDIYKVNVADQTNQPAIDLLYSNNAENQSSGSPTLSFTHQLSQIAFSITKDNTVPTLNGLTVTFKGLNTTADFNLADGKLSNIGTPADIQAYVNVDQAALIALPTEDLGDVTVTFEVNGASFTATYPGTSLEAGKKYTHKVSLKDSNGQPTIEFSEAVVTDWTEVAGGDINVDFSDGETPVTESVLLDETFDKDQGSFTINNVTLPEGSTYVWSWASYSKDNTQYMKASAYVNKTNYAAESWLISPEVDMTEIGDATLYFNHCHRFGADKEKEMTLWITETSAENWQQITIPNYGTGSSYTYVGDTISLKSYAGKKVKIAFKYLSSTDGAPTWQINDVKIVGTPKAAMEPTVLYLETLGTPEKSGNYWPYTTAYTGYTDTHNMTLTGYNTTVRLASNIGNIWFPKSKESCYFQIAGFETTSYSTITLTYQVASDTKDVDQNELKVETDKGSVEIPSSVNSSTSVYQEVSVTLPVGMTYVKFSNPNGTHNFRLTNIKVVGE